MALKAYRKSKKNIAMPMVFQILNSLEAAEMKILRVTNIFVVHRYST